MQMNNKDLKTLINLIDDFKVLVIEMIQDGAGERYQDHYEFLNDCWETILEEAKTDNLLEK